MDEHAVVIDVSRYHPAAGKREELLAAMQRLADQASAADGCFGAKACASDQEPDSLIAISRWKSAAALRSFADTAAMVAERDRLTTLLDRPAGHEHLTPI
jgi:quinol monooxygenase YgiN